MPKVNALKQQLLQEFTTEQVQVKFEYTLRMFSHFEVTVNGKLVHSKQNGAGYVDDKKKLAKICKAIIAEIKKESANS